MLRKAENLLCPDSILRSFLSFSKRKKKLTDKHHYKKPTNPFQFSIVVTIQFALSFSLFLSFFHRSTMKFKTAFTLFVTLMRTIDRRVDGAVATTVAAEELPPQPTRKVRAVYYYVVSGCRDRYRYRFDVDIDSMLHCLILVSS